MPHAAACLQYAAAIVLNAADQPGSISWIGLVISTNPEGAKLWYMESGVLLRVAAYSKFRTVPQDRSRMQPLPVQGSLLHAQHLLL